MTATRLLRRSVAFRPALVCVLAALLVAACGYSGSHAARVRQWASANSYVSNEAQVVSDADHAELAAAKGTAKQLQTVCGGLSSDIGTLYDTLPTPDAPATSALNAASTSLYDGAELCAATASTRTARVRRALADIRRGLAALGRANERLASFGVRARGPA